MCIRDSFNAIQNALGDDLPIIAEDLGIITDEVNALREHFHFPGMKVLQFAFDSTLESSYLPHQFTSPDCVCYTGTHDNDTTSGWYQHLPPDCQEKVRRYTCCKDASQIGRCLIRTCLGSIARYSIFPLQEDVYKRQRLHRIHMYYQEYSQTLGRIPLDPVYDLVGNFDVHVIGYLRMDGCHAPARPVIVHDQVMTPHDPFILFHEDVYKRQAQGRLPYCRQSRLP